MNYSYNKTYTDVPIYEFISDNLNVVSFINYALNIPKIDEVYIKK